MGRTQISQVKEIEVKKIMVLLVLVLLLSGCASTRPMKTLQKVSLNSPMKNVVEIMGRPAFIRGIIKNKYGEVIEVWEYSLAEGEVENRLNPDLLAAFDPLSSGVIPVGKIQNYWLYFANDELVRLGQAGNWEKDADRIYNVRFKSGEELTRYNK